MSDKKIEFKTFSFKLDDVDSQGIIRGYASTFGNIDLGADVVDKGAFKKTIKESGGRVPILADHDPTKQVGWNIRAEEDEKGLLVEGKLDLNVQLARERYSLSKTALEIGAKMGLSIGYMTIKGEPDKENPRVRRLKELKLFEYSLVTFPMNTAAMVTAAKGVGSLDKARVLLDHLKNEGITLKDLEIALQTEAVKNDYDPAKLGQSLDNLISKFKN